MNAKHNLPPIPWSHPLAVDDVPEAGGHYELEADAQTRENVAKVAQLRDLSSFQAVFDVVRRGAGVRVSGQVTARVGQTCVVTLEPIENDVAEPVDVSYAPAITPDEGHGSHEPKKGAEPPEPLLDGIVDLGAIATEFLILGLDPYPRKDGVEFPKPELTDDATHPFAALEALKKSSGSNLK
jgi:uncharacterized metal-binding protein YceD (DUF177 family)